MSLIDRLPHDLHPDRWIFPTGRFLAGHDRLSIALGRLLRPFNLFDPRRHTDPYPFYDTLRAAGPVHRQRLTRTWLVSGYQACTELLRAPASVERIDLFRVTSPYRLMRDDNLDLLSKAMLMRDAPSHTRLRRLVNRAFTPSSIATIEDGIEALTSELLDELERDLKDGGRAAGPLDVMSRFAERLPVFVIADLLGVPPASRDELKRLSDQMSKFVEPMLGFDPTEMDAAIDRARHLFSRLADERAASPEDDLMTGLVRLETGRRGDRPSPCPQAGPGPDTTPGLDRDELIAMALLLLIAGHETTSGLIGIGLVALGRNTDARNRVLSEPSLIPNAIEELLRYDSPVQATDRLIVEDVEIDGVHIPAGGVALIMLGAANRDPAVYDRADQLILDRPAPRPLSFGHGAHHCLGAALARLEGSIAIPAFLRRFPDFRIAEEGLTWRRSMSLRGPLTLPIHAD